MARLKQTAVWWCCVREGMLTPEQFISTVAEIGYDAIEMADPGYWLQIKEHGLKIATMNGHASIEEGLNRREDHARIEQEILKNIELAVKWEIPYLICFSGSRAGLADSVGAAQTAEGLQRVARAAEEAGVTLVLELLNSKVDHPDYQCDKTPWGVEVCQMVNSPAVRLLYDAYHMQIMEGDLIRTIRENHQWFGHYHIAGNPGRHEPDETQEIYHPAIFQAIAATGFTGYVGHEYVPVHDPVESLKASFEMGNILV
ncbi:MAG TPA: TIM barrel protein [Ktedonobacteraceae bacterium]|jgi:hydroxypyruvate isomerase|nr:TIM barrel protein [Ktedonobacteraceae bacterium]